MNNIARVFLLSLLSIAVAGCGGGGSSADTTSNTDTSQDSTSDTTDTSTDTDTTTDDSDTTAAVNITNAIFVDTTADCAFYANDYEAMAMDEQRSLLFDSFVTITSNDNSCTISSNGIPNHDFNDVTAAFATPVSEVDRAFTIVREPTFASEATSLSQGSWDAVMRNGVVVDLLSAGCYRPNAANADANGNVAIGCSVEDGWLMDPLAEEGGFGSDEHHAHTQPDGTYHYHGNPNAMFDDAPGLYGSPVIGFAADGFPIYGSYFVDEENSVRKAVSGYTLKQGNRPGPDDENPGGVYDGTYIDDYEFTDAGDLDECNGMTVNGQYGYYVTDNYPWILNCFKGSVHASFNK